MYNGLHHVVLYCQDTAASRAWYETLGLRWDHGFGGMEWFDLGDGTMLMLHPWTGAPHDSTPQLYLRTDDVQAAFDAVKAAGMEPEHHQAEGPLDAPHTTPWGSREFELYDPDGHRWGIVEAAVGENS